MANKKYAQLLSELNANIKANGNEEITGNILNAFLLNLLDSYLRRTVVASTAARNSLADQHTGMIVTVENDTSYIKQSDGTWQALSTYTKTEIDNLLSNKVDKVSGKGLSANDFTDALLAKLNNVWHSYSKVFYVDPVGGDNSDAEEGNIQRPYASLEYVYDNETLGSGDTVIIMNGTDDGAGKLIDMWDNGEVVSLNGSKLKGYRFRDNGSDVTFSLMGDSFEWGAQRAIHTTANSTIYVNVNRFNQNVSATSVDPIRMDSGTLYFTANYMNCDATNWWNFSLRNVTGKIWCNYVFAKTAVVQAYNSGGASDITFEANHVIVGTSATNEKSFKSSGSGTKLNVKINRLELSQTANSLNWGFEAESGGELIVNGVEIISNSTVAEIFNINTNSTCWIKNCKILFNDNTVSKPVITLLGNSSKLYIINSFIENKNQVSAAHVINTSITSSANTANIFIESSKLIVDETARAAGAKQINASNALNVDADTLNGVFDLTNITNIAKYQSDTKVTLTDKLNLDWDLEDGTFAEVDITDDRNFNAVTNQKPLGKLFLKIKDTRGDQRILTWDSNFIWKTGFPPELNNEINGVTLIEFYSDGTNMYEVATSTETVITKKNIETLTTDTDIPNDSIYNTLLLDASSIVGSTLTIRLPDAELNNKRILIFKRIDNSGKDVLVASPDHESSISSSESDYQLVEFSDLIQLQYKEVAVLQSNGSHWYRINNKM